MSAILKLSSIPESHFIEISIEERVYKEFLLPFFKRLSYTEFPLLLKKEKLQVFKEIVEKELSVRTKDLQPEEGQYLSILFVGKRYMLTRLNKEHQVIYKLHNIYEMIMQCIQKDITLQFEYIFYK